MMNVHAEKFQLIEWLVQLKDTAVLEQVKSLKDENEQFTPLTSDELHERALASERDIAEGNVIPLQDKSRKEFLLKKLSGAWKDDPVLSSDELIEDIYNSRTISDKKIFEE